MPDTLSTKVCAVEGCDRDAYSKRLCSMHYLRQRRHGDAGGADRQRGNHGAGSTGDHGYRIIHAPGHPMARKQDKALEHRVVLYDAIGEGPHPCYWCGRSLTWIGRPADRICVDHLDHDRLNNARSNLVPSCLDCNTKRR